MAKDWSSGICSCLDDYDSCCLAFTNPYTMQSVTKSWVDGSSPWENAAACMCCTSLLCGLNCIVPTLWRQEIRQFAGLPTEGTMVMDCLYHWCIPCCAAAQEAREVKMKLNKKMNLSVPKPLQFGK
eukprot:tig00000147_g9460.t1